MSIRMGIYDFFSYVIPGGIFISAFQYLFQKYYFQLINLTGISFVEFLVWGSLAYLVGLAIDPLISKSWYRLFRRKNLFEETMEKFNERHPAVDVLFQEMDWYILLSFIKKHNIEMAYDIEKFNVINIMLRNSSFGILVYAAIFVFEFILNNYFWIYAVFAILSLIISIVLVQQSVKFQKWFYESIYQTVIALTIEIEKLPIKFIDTNNDDASLNK